MSTKVSDIVNDVALWANDRNFSRISRDNWLTAYNTVQTEIATECKVLEEDADFDIIAGEQRYTYPDDSVAVRSIRYSITPEDPNSFRWLKEFFESEWRERVDYRYPTGDVVGYMARQMWFELIPQPVQNIVGGGILSYCRVPVWVASADLPLATLELPDMLRPFLVRGLQIKGKELLRNYTEAKADREVWIKELGDIRDKIEDRSLDRRSQMAPRGLRYPYAGQS